MWLFTTHGFISAVQNRYNHDEMYVRARDRAPLEALFPERMIIANAGTDYKYRVLVPRERVAQVVAEYVMNTDAENFKSAVEAKPDHKPEYIDALHDVWLVMYSAFR